jgi:hypothetical protein
MLKRKFIAHHIVGQKALGINPTNPAAARAPTRPAEARPAASSLLLGIRLLRSGGLTGSNVYPGWQKPGESTAERGFPFARDFAQVKRDEVAEES